MKFIQNYKGFFIKLKEKIKNLFLTAVQIMERKIFILLTIITLLFFNTSCLKKSDQLVEEGNNLHIQGNDERAMDCFNRAIELEPENIEAWKNKGMVLYYQARYDEATECCNKILQIEPSNEDTRELKYNIYKILFENTKNIVYEKIILSFATCRGYITQWELSGSFKITQETLKEVSLETDSLEKLLNKEFSKKELGDILRKLNFNKGDRELIFDKAEFSLEDDNCNNADFQRLYNALIENGLIEDLKKSENEVNTAMLLIEDPPDEYKEAYGLMVEFDEYYKEVVHMAINPYGPCEEFKNKVNDLDNKSLEIYNKLKSSIPE